MVDAQVVARVDRRVPVGEEGDVVPRVIVAWQPGRVELVDTGHEGFLRPEPIRPDHVAKEVGRRACWCQGSGSGSGSVSGSGSG